MYRDFSHKEITLKVWTGEQWKWMRCRLYGREFPAEAELMSPSVTFEKKYLMLHVPVKEFTADTATVKQRIQEGRKICAIQFTNGDVFAVGTVCDGTGKETDEILGWWKRIYAPLRTDQEENRKPGNLSAGKNSPEKTGNTGCI